MNIPNYEKWNPFGDLEGAMQYEIGLLEANLMKLANSNQ